MFTFSIPLKMIIKSDHFSSELPSETQYRRVLKTVEADAMKTFEEDFKFQKTFAIMDETSILGNKNIHGFVGKLYQPKFTKLVDVKMVENTTADSDTYLLDDVLRQLKRERNVMVCYFLMQLHTWNLLGKCRRSYILECSM